MRQLLTKPDVRLCSLFPPYRFDSPYGGQGFVLLLHSDDPKISAEAQTALAKQIVASGCRYVCCSGMACRRWETAVDMAYIETDPNYQPPDETFILTTSHEQENLNEVVWFALINTSFDNFVAERILIVMLNPTPGREAEFVAAVTSGR